MSERRKLEEVWDVWHGHHLYQGQGRYEHFEQWKYPMTWFIVYFHRAEDGYFIQKGEKDQRGYTHIEL